MAEHVVIGAGAALSIAMPNTNMSAQAAASGLCMDSSLGMSHEAERSEAQPAHFTVIASPLRSAETISPDWWPVSESTAPFSLVSTIAPAPALPTAAPTPPAP